LEGARLGGVVRVGGLDRAAACSLCVHLADFRTRADLAPAGSSVEIQAEGLPVAHLLHRLEEWTRAWDLPSVRINLDGRDYVLEPAPPTAAHEELLPSASPAA
jgi:hypothetical protein